MDNIATIENNNDVKITNFNEGFKNIKQAVASKEGAMFGDCFPLKHTFADGIYVREINVPSGHLVITKTFKQNHATFLMSGEVSILTENGVERISAPKHFITTAGVKRIIYCHTDTVWVTVHGNKEDEQNIDKIESFVIDEKDSIEGIENILEKHNLLENKGENI